MSICSSSLSSSSNQPAGGFRNALVRMLLALPALLVVAPVALAQTITAGVINLANQNAYSVTGTCTTSPVNVTIGSITVAPAPTCTANAYDTGPQNVSSLADGVVSIVADEGSGPVNQDVLKDTVAPILSINPAPALITSTNAAAYSLAGTCTENGQGVTVQIGILSTTPTCTSAAWDTGPVDVSSLADGPVFISASQTDLAGNPGFVNDATLKDAINPTVTLDALAAITAANETTYSVSGTCSEDTRTVSVQIGSVNATPTCSGTTWSTGPVDVSSLAQGPVSVSATHTDLVGNSATASNSTTKDTIGPALTIGTLDPINNGNSATYGFAGTCEAGGGTVDFTLTGGATISGNVPCGAGTYAVGPLDATGLTDGVVAISVTQLDALGNSATANGGTLKDTINPSVTFDAVVPIVPGNVAAYTVSGTCSENGAAVNFAVTDSTPTTFFVATVCGAVTPGIFSLTGDYSGLAEGTVTFFAQHQDAGGNQATANIPTVKDTVLPVVFFAPQPPINISNAGAYLVSGACSEDGRDVTLTITDSAAATFTTPLVCGGPGPGLFSITGDFQGLAEGTVSFSVSHADAAGNTATANVSVLKDTIGVSVAIDPVAAINSANAAAYTVSGTCSEDGNFVTLTVTDSASNTFSTPLVCGAVTTGTFSLSGDFSGLAEGIVNFTAQFTDAGLNSATANASALKDTVSQTPVITAPADASTVGPNPTISGNGETGATVTVYEGANIACTSPVVAGAWTCNSTLGPGVYTIAAALMDAAGNPPAVSTTVTFTVLAGQTITFDPLGNVTFGAAPFGVAATASSGLAVTFTSLSTGVCTISGNTVTLVGVGICTIAADQAGDATFIAAPRVTQSFTVAQGTQTITFAALADRAQGASPFTVAATASSGLAVTFSSLTAPVCTVAGTQVTLVSVGLCTIAADQAGNANVAAAPQVTRSFQVLCDTGLAGDCDNDGIPNLVEPGEGRNPLVKDNDIFTNSRLFVMQQYRDFLGREGDAGGIAFSVNLLDTGAAARANIIESFFSSAEFSGTASPVVRLYFATFLRIPDFAGLQFQINAYRSGTPLPTIANNFTLSPEFQTRYGALTDAQYVTLLYQNVLGRTPVQAEIDFHVARLTGGATRGEVLAGFSESPEFQASTAIDVYVTMMYVGMLGRAPEQAGFDFWVAYREAGNPGINLILGFLNAPEYRARFLP